MSTALCSERAVAANHRGANVRGSVLSLAGLFMFTTVWKVCPPFVVLHNIRSSLLRFGEGGHDRGPVRRENISPSQCQSIRCNWEQPQPVPVLISVW